MSLPVDLQGKSRPLAIMEHQQLNETRLNNSRTTFVWSLCRNISYLPPRPSLAVSAQFTFQSMANISQQHTQPLACQSRVILTAGDQAHVVSITRVDRRAPGTVGPEKTLPRRPISPRNIRSVNETVEITRDPFGTNSSAHLTGQVGQFGLLCCSALCAPNPPSGRLQTCVNGAR